MRPNSVYWDEMAVCGEFTNYINNYHFYYMMVRYNLNLNLKKKQEITNYTSVDDSFYFGVEASGDNDVCGICSRHVVRLMCLSVRRR